MPTRDELGAALRKADAAAKAGDPKAADAARRFAMAIRDMDAQQSAPKPAPAMQMQPAPKPAPMPMQSGQPNISPMGGVGEFDSKAFAGLKLPQQQASTENPIIAEQRRQQDLAGRNFAAQQPGRMAKEQRWKDELAAMNAAGVIPFKNNGPDGPLELNQERPDQFFGRAAGSFVNSNIGLANTAAQVGLNTANAYGAGFDPAMQGAMAGGEYGDISQRVADAATAGGYAQNQQKIDDIIPSLPIPAAQTPGEMGADVFGNLAAVFTGWGAPLLKAGEKFSETMAAVPGLSRTLRGVGVETGENAALAYGMGAGAAPPGSDRNMAGTQSAADPLNYVSIEALRALGRIPGQIDRALPATNAGAARPGPIDTAALEPRPPAAAPPAAAVTPNAPAATPAPPQPPVTAVPSFQRQPAPTATAQAAGAPPIQPPPPAVATANAAVPTPGAVPPAGTLTPVGNGVAVDSFNNLPVKTRESVLRALEASGMNRQQAFDAITSLNDLPPDRANMFEFELIRRYGGPDKFPNLQANLTTMGSDFSIQTPKKGGSPQDVMNKSLLDQAQSEGDYLTRTAEQLFGEGKVATKEELEAFRTQLGGRYRTQLAETYPGMTRLRNAASKQALAATVDAGRKNLTDYLLRPDVIEQVPPWVQDQVMMQVSDDLRWLQKDDAGLQFASKANPELTPLLTSDQTLRYSPQLWRTLVQMYPTQVGHSLQSAYRAAIDDAFSGVSNAIDRTTAKKLMRLRGQSRVRANASDPNKRGVGLLHLLEEASPGYKKLRQEYGDVVGAQKAADMPDSFFRVAKDEEALADFVDVYENELTPLQQNAVRNGITTQIRQALKNKTEFTQPWEVDAAERGRLPNMTAISSQTFLEALPKVFGREGDRMADAIRLSRANVDNIQAINKNFASGTPKGIDIRANANQLYEHPASTKLNPVDNFATTMGSVGLGTAFVPGGQMVSIGLLTGAAGRALYRAYKQGKSLSPSQKEALAEWLFKPRRETDAMPPSTPRGFSKLGYAGNVATGAGIGAAAGAMNSGGDPATTAEGAVIGALGGGARAGLRARRANSSIIKSPPARNPRRGPPPFDGNRVTGAGPAPQITPPGSPPVQNGFFGGGRKPPGPPKPPPVEPDPVPSIASADLRPAVAKNVTTFKPQKPGIPKIGQTQNIASVTTKDGRQYDVTAEVFKDRDAVVMSPSYPSNITDDLESAIRHQRSTQSARKAGMDIVNDAPRAPDWAEQNPKEWGDVQRQVGERFLGMVNSTPGPHVLALVDGIDINSLATLIEDGLPKGKVIMRSPGNGELAVVNRGQVPEQFARWETYSNLRFNQKQGILPPPADWASAKPAATSATSSVTPLKPAPKPPIVKNGLGGSKLPMDEPSRMARAREQGFDVDTPLYHGTAADVEAFNFEDIANMDFDTGAGVFLTRSPSEAGYFVKTQTDSMGSRSNEYVKNANIVPVYARLRNPVEFETQRDFRAAVADTSYDRRGPGYAFKRDMEALGHDGVIVRNSQMDGQDGAEWRIIFDPSNIRGKFAKFDPAESGSSKLLAGMADNASGKGALGGMALGGTFAPDANGDGVVDAQERANGALGGAVSLGVLGSAFGKGARALNARGANKLARGRTSGVDQANFGAPIAKPGAEPPTIKLSDLKGAKIFHTTADHTRTGGAYTGIDSSLVDNPVPLPGGPKYGLRPDNAEHGVAFANNGGVAGQKVTKITNHGATHMIINVGDANQHISSVTANRAFFDTMRAYVRDGRISQKNARAITKLIKGSVTKDEAVNAAMKAFPGFEDVKALDDYARSISFEARKRLLTLVGSKDARELGAPNLKRILDATREPETAGRRWGDGEYVVKLDPNGTLVKLGDQSAPEHPDFPTGIRGEVIGKLEAPINYETLAQDWLAADKAAKLAANPNATLNQRRGFDMARPVIEITDDLLARVGEIKNAGIESARHAKLTADFAADNWRVSNLPVKQGGSSPADFINAIDDSPGAAVLDTPDLSTLKKDIRNGKTSIYQLGDDGQVFFSLERGDPGYEASYGVKTPGIGPNEVKLGGVINNELGAGGMGHAVMLKALTEGATVLDAFAVKSAAHPDGFLPEFYRKFGFEVVAEVPFDKKYYTPQKLADAVDFWKKSTKGYDPEINGYPPLVIMKWTGTDAQRANLVAEYHGRGLQDLFPGRDQTHAAPDWDVLSGDATGKPGKAGSGGRQARGAGGDQGYAGKPLVPSALTRATRGLSNLSDAELRNLGRTPADREAARKSLGLKPAPRQRSGSPATAVPAFRREPVIAQQGFGSSRPKPPPANRLAVPKQLAASLNKSKVSPPLREKLTANAALPPGERKSIMEATGWDNEILRIAAPFIREGTRMDTEIGAKVAALIKQANQNPVEYALQQQMARSAMQIAETELKTARRAQGQATRALNTQRERNLGNPNTDQVRQITEPYRQRRAETELAVSEAARMRDEARAAAERANIQLAGLEETRAYAQREIQRITDALGANRPNTKGTAMLPAYNPMGKGKPGPINPAGAKPNKQAAEELAHMLFEADQAELFAKLQAGDITPQNRKALGMAASYYARHPGMAVLTAAGAAVTGAGAVSIYADQKKRSEDVREVARQRQAEPERPGFKWDWDTQSKKRDFVVTLQSSLNDLGYEIGSVDGSMIRADGKQTKTQKALEHFLWSLDNTRVPGSPVTEDDWKAIEREALAARRKRA